MQLKNISIAILLVDGKIIDVSGKKYYEIPWLFWDFLAEKSNTGENIDSKQMERLYYKILSESISEK